jgi:V8-like Glu-specific endopeptidase
VKWRAAVLGFALFLGLIPSHNAQAIYNGTSALGSPYVVKYRTSNSWCSGTLVEPQILVTAAHCIVDYGIAEIASDIGVYPPGVDTSKSVIVARGYQIFYPSGFYNNSEKIEPNDIAFVVLEKAVNSSVRLKLATYEITQQMVAQGIQMIGMGYGRTGQQNIYPVAPLQYVARPISQDNFRGFAGYERTYISYAADENGDTCPGDSGGPTIAQYKGEAYLVSIHSGGRGPCSTNTAGSWSSTATIAGEYQNLYNAATSLLARLKPTDVSNVRIAPSGLTGTISWDLPKNSPAVPTGYLVKDASSNELCRTTTNSCQVTLKPGSNLLTVFALAGSIPSNGVVIEYVVKNASNPDFIGFDTYQTQVAAKWAPIREFGGANPSNTYVEIRDESNGFVLCTALSSQNECRFSLEPKGFNLLLNVKSDLGQTEAYKLGRFSGILQTSLVSRTLSSLDDINTQLRSYLSTNPEFKVEIEQMKSQLPILTSNFIFTDDVLNQVFDTRDRVSVLVLRILASPKKSTITCVKGKLTKKVTAVNPKCPTGYKVKK